MEVASPNNLVEWANDQRPRRSYALWDLTQWMPFNPAETLACGNITGLKGDSCWSTVYVQEMFPRLMYDILEHPCDLVMSEPQTQAGYSLGAKPSVSVVYLFRIAKPSACATTD